MGFHVGCSCVNHPRISFENSGHCGPTRDQKRPKVDQRDCQVVAAGATHWDPVGKGIDAQIRRRRLVTGLGNRAVFAIRLPPARRLVGFRWREF